MQWTFNRLVSTGLFLSASITHTAFANQATDAIAPEQSTGLEHKQLVKAKDYMVTAANPMATQAGADVLEQGGNAIDAMVAVQLMLGLVEPQSSGIGGGAFLVYWDGEQQSSPLMMVEKPPPCRNPNTVFGRPRPTAAIL